MFQEVYKKWSFSISKTKVKKILNTFGIKIGNYIDFPSELLIKDIEKNWEKYNYFNSGEVIQKNRPIIKGLNEEEWVVFIYRKNGVVAQEKNQSEKY